MNALSTVCRTGNLLTAKRVLDRCHVLSKCSEDPSNITRTFFSVPMREAHRHLREWMEALGMSVCVDAIGNLRGVYPASQSSPRRLLIGSHIDTVPNAGAYDGVLGVILALGLIEALRGTHLAFEIEVIAFSDEEGVRFATPFLGSRALVGDIDESLLSRIDARGITLRQAILDYGLDPGKLPEARIGNSVFAYLEFHIEQGPVLDELGSGLGVVEAIVGQTRLQIDIRGRANHAGTTPMTSRQDALAGAAELVLGVESVARATPGLVATVGKLCVSPGAANVIPETVEMTVDIRHRHDDIRAASVDAVKSRTSALVKARGLSIVTQTLLDQAFVAMAPHLVNALETAAVSAGYIAHRMNSGAGHDAMILAEVVPAAMLFLRSPGGVSHHPDETVLEEDVIAAIEAGLSLLNIVDRRAGHDSSNISEL